MKAFALAASILVIAACAETNANRDPNVRRERLEATTGSNIPRHDHDGSVTTYDREAVERAQSGSYGAPRQSN